MIFGLFDKIIPPGSMTISTDKANYAFGETVKGKITLTTKKPIQATALKVKIKCIERVTQTSISSKRASSSTSERPVWEFENIIDGEKVYNSAEYPFEIAIPKDLQNNSPEIQGVPAEAVKIAQMFGGGSKAKKWFIEGSLNIPGGRNIGGRMQINVV